MDSKAAFCSVLCKQTWRAFLSQHSIKPHPLGCVKDANEVPGELTFSEGQLAAFTTLHLGILHQMQLCFVPQLPARGGVQLTDAGGGGRGVALS